MRTVALQSALIAAVALSQSGSPVDDEAQTNSAAVITIPVLLNDPGGPSGSTLISVSAPTSGVATASISGDQVRYNPNGFIGNDRFTYTTDLGTASVVVAVTANVPTVADAPRDDTAQTQPGVPVRIPVLANDPEGSRITGIVVPGPANGTAVIDDDPPVAFDGSREVPGIVYTPNPGFVGTDTFQYTTNGGTATVTVIVDETAALPVGPPRNDDDVTPIDVPIIIRVLANDPPGSQILRVNDFVVDPFTGTTTRTLGRVELLGNQIRYTPDQNLQVIGDVDVFSYETQGGTAIVTVTIGAPGGAGRMGQVILVNNSSFNVRFRVLNPDPPAVFFEDCQNAFPRGFQDVGLGTQVPPMASVTVLCVGVGQTAGPISVEFEARITGASTTPALIFPLAIQSCTVAPLPAPPATITIIDAPPTAVGIPPMLQLTGIQFGPCP